jgi:nucleoside diphosphate kinase
MKTLKKYYEDLVLNPSPNAFCMLKPGFTQYKDEFEKQLAAKGWKIIAYCAKKFTRQEIEEFYSCHKDKDFYIKLCDYMITGHCECYSCYKRCDDPIKEMNKFKDKIRDEWGEDEMRNAMHSSDSKENVIRECSLAFNTVNEQLRITKNTIEHNNDNTNITAEKFFDALNSYTGEYKSEKLNGTFDLEKYCKVNNIDPAFVCTDENEENVFGADTITVEHTRQYGKRIIVLGKNQVGKTSGRSFTNFDDFIEAVLDRYGEHHDDPITGQEHLERIYNILIDNE